MENKNCQNCKKDFTIDQDDFNFYAKVNVPHPTFCPTCRMQRRMAFFNMAFLYRRKCDLCGEEMVSIYREDATHKVYCNPCWWSDKWDWRITAKDYDPSRTFLEQMIELRDETPFMALEGLYPTYINTIYSNNASYQKDCYMTLFSDFAERDIYARYTAHTKEVTDSYRVNSSELVYDSTGINKGYKCFFCEDVGDSALMWFSKSCYDCLNCFGCVNLRKKSYHIFNVPYSREEYFEKLKSFNLDSRKSLEEWRNKSEEFWLKSPRRYYMGDSMNVNVSGELIYNCRNTKDAFMTEYAENSRFTQFLTLPTTKDAYDYTGWGMNSELIYECYLVGSGAYNGKFSAECWPESQNMEYSYFCVNSPKNSFGCINTRNVEYCILNKQYTKEEYEKLKSEIIEDMKKNPYISKAGHVYAYGEFFPPEFSPYGYHETIANEYLPLTKEKMEIQGYNRSPVKVTERTCTILAEQIPDNSQDVSFDITNEVLECRECKQGFNIVPVEVERLQKLYLPYPDKCWKCRHKRRFERSPKPFLYDRNCDKCNMEIKTSYAGDRPEIVYCEKCYQQEVM